jgi:hypothetical protein
MAKDVYCVIPHEQEWEVSYNQKRFPYGTLREAIQASVNAAHIAGVSNPDGAEVLVQGDNNQFRTEWTYGTPSGSHASGASSSNSTTRGHKRDAPTRYHPIPSATPELQRPR